MILILSDHIGHICDFVEGDSLFKTAIYKFVLHVQRLSCILGFGFMSISVFLLRREISEQTEL